MQINKLKSYVGIANKAGYLIIGADNLNNYSKKLFLIVASNDGGKNLQKIVERTKEQTNCELLFIEDSIFKQLLNIENCKVFGLKNKGLSEQVIKIIRGENIE